MTRPPVSHVLETSLYVADLDRSEAFYGRLFGFETMLHDERMVAMAVPGRQVLLLFLRGGSLQPSASPAGLIPPHDALGLQHLCFSIAWADLDAWAAWLTESGVEVESRLAWPDKGTSLYFRDPDGHSIEVATSGLWANDPRASSG